MIKSWQCFIEHPTINATGKSTYNCEVKSGFLGQIETAKMRGGNLIHKKETLVVSTHGMVKKTSKVPRSEIKKAEQIRKEYFEDEQ